MSETAEKDEPANDRDSSDGVPPPSGPSLPGVRSTSMSDSSSGQRSSLAGRSESSGLMQSPPGTATPSGLNRLPPPPKGSGSHSAMTGLPPIPKGSGSHSAMTGLPPRPGDIFDEEQERWLIQKEDKMDYGPFSMREVRAQIEQGKVHAEHNILDNETGDRRRVADHPIIGQMAREWTAKHAELERQLKDQKERAKHRDAIVKLLSGILGILVVIGAAVGIYVKFIYKPPPPPTAKKDLISNEDFFKGMQISMKVDPPPPKKAHGGKRKGPKNGAFDDSQNLNFDEGGDVLSQEDINKVMQQKFGLLTGCLREDAQRNGTKKFDLDWLIKGNGSVSSVRVNGQTSSPVASCVFAKMQAIQFPECKTCSKTHASMNFGLK